MDCHELDRMLKGGTRSEAKNLAGVFEGRYRLAYTPRNLIRPACRFQVAPVDAGLAAIRSAEKTFVRETDNYVE